MKVYIFPGQGSQYPGMGLNLYKNNKKVANIFNSADAILDFKLSDYIFEGTEEQLKQTKISQLAIFVYSIACTKTIENFCPQAVAGHSLGEYSALVASQAISFEDCLLLIQERALAMQQAAEMIPGRMAAILGMDDNVIENVCESINEASEQKKVFLANYNCPGQAVISGTSLGIEEAIQALKNLNARRS